ncbi:MAG: hypothetical protein DIU59_017475 [Pseudomonadota bacterium]|jgi:hypothetical protein
MRRKGELSRAAIDHGWPFQVALPTEDERGERLRFDRDAERFCRGLHLSLAPRQHHVCRDDKWWTIYCFAEAEHAERFRKAFDGVPFDPRERGKGRGWMKWEASSKHRGPQAEGSRKCRENG